MALPRDQLDYYGEPSPRSVKEVFSSLMARAKKHRDIVGVEHVDQLYSPAWSMSKRSSRIETAPRTSQLRNKATEDWGASSRSEVLPTQVR